MENNKPPSNIQVLLGVLIFTTGIVVLYIKIFSTSDYEIGMDKFGELYERDNSVTLPIMKACMIILPIVGLYYFIKGRRK
ncbi:MAG: hypothetical protein ACTHMC_18480 [Pseudobacter sp.]|uniref:hypothetical protein n=1 Tax=Pseudobacter sp. TaxID=2045420 RepID=UPI003F7D4F83